MSIQVNDKNLGHVSAYAYAKSKGYTGTEEQFATLMASYATVAQSAQESAESAAQSKQDAQAAMQTAVDKALEATTAAQTATAKASEASASATSATTSAQTASTKASEATTAAQTATTESASASRSASQALTSKTAAQSAQTAAESAQRGAEAAQAAAEDVLESIPADYSTLSEDVDDLKSSLSNRATWQMLQFNQWDEKWIHAYIDSTTGLPVASTGRIASENYIPVLPNTEYYFNTNNKGVNVIAYDANKTLIEGFGGDVNYLFVIDGTFTTPINCCYLKFYGSAQYGKTYNNNLCLNLSITNIRSEYHNGVYVPYTEWTDAYERILSNDANIYDIEELTYTPNNSKIWRMGYVNKASGAIVDSIQTICFREKILLTKGTVITADTGYKFGIAFFDKETGKKTGYISTAERTEYVIQIDSLVLIDFTNETVIDDLESFSTHINFTYPLSEKVRMMEDDSKISTMYRVVNFGNVNLLSGYYNGLGDDYSLFNKDTTSAEIYSAYDALVSENPYYITKSDLGASSNGDNLFSYDFKPKYAANARKKMPKIVIITAQHGSEKSSAYGLYYMMRDICKNWDKNTILDYLRNHVEIIVIPVVNRYGFDNFTYKNANGVNINRNYDTPEFVVGDDPTSTSYGGQAPFDQPETQMVRDLMLANKDCFLFVDWHTNGFYKVDTYSKINWVSTGKNDDDYVNNRLDALAYHFSNITAHMTKDYGFADIADQMCGYMSIEDAFHSTAQRWCGYALDVLSITFETNNGFPNESESFSANEQMANSELMGNWLATLFSVYSQILN